MKLGRSVELILLAGVLLGDTASARAEEIILKDGQRIVGTIVGYEKDMFRVETSYGIALIRKDKVASIQVSKPGAADQAGKSDNPPEANADTAKPQSSARPAAKTASSHRGLATAPAADPAAGASADVAAKPAVPPPAVVRIPVLRPMPIASPAPPVALKLPASEVESSKFPSSLPPPPPVSQPLDVPMPVHLQEHVDGNTYFSDTFKFSMYKPPDWKIFEGVPKETGSGIMAMGTDDELTLLIVDRQVWSGTPKLTSDQVEANLRQTYQDYRRISEGSFECDGQAAIRRTFSGILDGAEWHGVAVHVIHGNMVFGIIGLTSAETYQFQEALFNKIIKTFHFAAALKPGETGTTGNSVP